jgi:hypothetical protein
MDKNTRDNMARYIPRFFLSVSELIRAALLERLLHTADFDDEFDGTIGEHANPITITRSSLLDTFMQQPNVNHSAFIRATVQQYCVKLSELKSETT